MPKLEHADGCGCVRAVEIRGILSTNQSYLSCGDAVGALEERRGDNKGKREGDGSGMQKIMIFLLYNYGRKLNTRL